MAPIVFRAFVTVLTVAVGLAAGSLWGDTNRGKLLAAAVIAAAVALVEWLMVWTPRHSAVARRLLDNRSVMTGLWVQEVYRIGGARPDSTSDSNRLAIYTVDHSPADGYKVRGRAFDASGEEVARFWSVGTAGFSHDGREMTYVFEGVATGRDHHSEKPMERTGLVKLTLSTDDSGTGRVEHVAENRSLDFDIFRVTPAWLARNGLSEFDPGALRDIGHQPAFARAYARRLATSGG
jgi:hypothetical protein